MADPNEPFPAPAPVPSPAGDPAVLSDDASGSPGEAVADAVVENRDVKTAVKEEAGRLRSKATDEAQALAARGKDKATEKLEGVSRLIDDAATQVDDRLGAQYGDYARSAAGFVQGFADTLRDKDIDDLLADARAFVRKSPILAVGTAATIGFVLARLARAGYEATDDVNDANA